MKWTHVQTPLLFHYHNLSRAGTSTNSDTSHSNICLTWQSCIGCERKLTHDPCFAFWLMQMKHQCSEPMSGFWSAYLLSRTPLGYEWLVYWLPCGGLRFYSFITCWFCILPTKMLFHSKICCRDERK
ncbi:hypothetical protein EmuJ_000457400 [Echinococcus multilocularis]|uniref:Uncharacterized protein n=1 Tax=Echinococcus multilocularis TaxID=6211 RepID=A0A068XY40_ECHMU|nr:hypothetical protein EmuJ_000457400 [Echinococcus multilocularis]